MDKRNIPFSQKLGRFDRLRVLFAFFLFTELANLYGLLAGLLRMGQQCFRKLPAHLLDSAMPVFL
jgi:hypothetical protein